MSYINDIKLLTLFIVEFIIDFIKGILYYAISGLAIVMDIILSIIKALIPLSKELKANLVEFAYIMNGLLYVISYELANILSSFFVYLGKSSYYLADKFDKVARYLFPKSFNLRR